MHNAHQSLSSPAHVCVGALIGCRHLIVVVVSSVLSAGQALRAFVACVAALEQVPLDASLEQGELKQRCSSQSQSEWVCAAFISSGRPRLHTARVGEPVADGRATLQSL